MVPALRESEATSPASPVDFSPALAVANAVLYEGYLLYPYRQSAPKNRIRFQFGVLAPRRWVDARPASPESIAGAAEGWWSKTECLLEADPARVIECRVRFLSLQAPEVGADGPSIDGPSIDRAVPVEVPLVAPLAALLHAPRERAIWPSPSGAHEAPPLGRLVVSAEPADTPFRLYRLRVRVENVVSDLDPNAPREEALRRAMVATHVLAGARCGRFLSLVDPPEWAAAAAARCRNVRTYPVLAGPEGQNDLVLSSPIILYDHPAVSAESPGDLFDAAEIDEILSLRTATLTEDEKAEARATDPQAAALIDRVEGLPHEILERLHGAVRPLLARRPPLSEVPAGWDFLESEDDIAAEDEILIDDRPVRRGSLVRLRPLGRADALDLFLEGRVARVRSIFTDIDGSRFLAVVVGDDADQPRALQFRPDEVEPLDDTSPSDAAYREENGEGHSR